MPRDLDVLIATLDLDEKAALLAGADLWSTVAVERLGIPSVNVTDGPSGARGPALPPMFASGPTFTSVCFPSGASLGASWDVDLLERVGRAIAECARDLACRVLLAPTVNLHRSPLGGRNFESYAEDPLLAGRLGAAFVRGAQSAGVACTVKHFAGNESETDRMLADSVIDERTLREVHLLPFELAVEEGGALGVMTAYNRLNGTYCSDSRFLLEEVLRGDWGFDGVVVSDWFAAAHTSEAIAAGLDLEMPGPGRAYGPALAAAVRAGDVDEGLVDAAVRRLLGVLDRVGALDDDPAVQPRSTERPEHRAVAREAAAAGAVLLVNDGVLPLVPDRLRRVAVIGPNAGRAVIMGGGSASLPVARLRTPLEALSERLGPGVEVVHEPGVDRDGIGRAVSAARDADAVVLVVGTDGDRETEGRDRDSMALPGGQDELVARVLDVAPDAVVVVNSGSVVTLPWAERARAVLQLWFGGQEMAEALVDVLVGDAEPGGRLPTTVPVRLEHNPSYGNFPAEGGTVRYGEGVLVGHRWYESRRLPVTFPFGHGLSYTRVVLGEPEVSARSVEPGGEVVVRVPVTNVGDRSGAEVVQLYVAPLQPRAFRPVQELKGFAKVTLDPGRTGVVEIVLGERAFARWAAPDPALAELVPRLVADVPWTTPPDGMDQHGWVVDGGPYELRVGRSSADIVHTVTVEVPATRPLGTS